MKEFFKYIINKEKFPYFLTLVVGLLIFQFNFIIHQQSNIPLLVYSFKEVNYKKDSNKEFITYDCIIQNINNNKAFRNIKIHIRYKDNLANATQINFPEIIPISPSSSYVEIKSLNDQINEYKIKVIQPFSKYILRMKCERDLYIKEFPKLYIYSDDDIQLVKDSMFYKIFIKEQLLFNAILIIFWLLLIFLYLYSLFKTHKNEN